MLPLSTPLPSFYLDVSADEVAGCSAYRNEAVGAIRRRAVFSNFIVSAAEALPGFAASRADLALPGGVSGQFVSVKDNMQVRFHASEDAGGDGSWKETEGIKR